MALYLGAMAATSAATLKILKPSLPPSLGNPFTATGQPSIGIWSAIYDGLTRIGETGALEPGLAVAWRSVDPTTWQFDLRPGVLFHSGQRFDAETAVAVLEFLRGPVGRTQLVAGELANVASVRALAPDRIEVKTLTPDAILPRRISVVAMVEPRLLGGTDFAAALTRETSGTGPFRLMRWGGDGSATQLEKFPPSWRWSLPEAGNLDRIEMIIAPEIAARMQAFAAGEADVIESPDPDGEAESAAATTKTVVVPTASVLAIALRNFGPVPEPLKDRRVRQALNYAIDRDAITSTIYGGRTSPASQGAVPGVVGFNPELTPYEFNPEMARQLLSDAGYAGGFAFDIEVFVGMNGPDAQAFQQLAQDLAAVGVRATVRPIPYPSWLSKYAGGQWGSVGAFIMSWDNNAYYDAIRPIRVYSCAKVNPFFCDEAMMPRIAATDGEFDPERRAGMLRDLMAEFRDLAPAIWIAPIATVFAMRPEVSNFTLRQGNVVFEKLRIAGP